MTGKSGTGAVVRGILTLLVTAALCAGCWWLWNEVPRWLRRTEFADYRYLASLVLIFLLLSLVNVLLRRVWDYFQQDG